MYFSAEGAPIERPSDGVCGGQIARRFAADLNRTELDCPARWTSEI